MTVQRRSILGVAAGALATGFAAACGAHGRRAASASPSPPPSADPTSGPSGPAAPTGPVHVAGEITHGPRRVPQVALTFHGAGDPGLARRLLAEFAKGGAAVTVLAVGTWLDEQPDTARAIVAAGHELGNHTLSHGDITAMTPERAYAEIAGCADRLRKLTGSPGRWFRPSQTQHASKTVRTQAARAGYHSCLSYDLDSLDNTDPGADAVTGTVLGKIANGSIVSMHLGHAGTVRAMPAILDGLGRRGLKPVTVSTLLAS
ncbi:polysaccharide deacetylase family protein [Actinomadura rupiterrae]|uniref:polysaccharide deacetylase family protein n=1 Tax=Actinomadura rupiterrae TaxID=559627 RepID=UPI0020A24417|nr:polysaccharide deacetylase family protein [Actinomadura rupiterrae]MCP2340775.1 peptidoglycan/xylan/chitin deacetylase (PgdA/CDA1 family) [Actinomadura rupiterrae]